MNKLFKQLQSIQLEQHPNNTPILNKPQTDLILYVDGSANPNPGVISLGLVLKFKNEVIWNNQFTSGEGTNNQAEFIAIAKGIELLEKVYSTSEELKNEKCTIVSDSRLATTALINSKPPKSNSLNLEYQKCFSALSSFDNELKPIILWQSRKHNCDADAMSKSYSFS